MALQIEKEIKKLKTV